MGATMKIRAVAIFAVFFPVLLFAEEPPSPALDKKLNPHTAKGNCQVCHVETEESLNAWSFFSSKNRRMKADHNEVCMQCHGLEFGHGVGQPPQVNLSDLPLDANGKIACALTCHDMHVVTQDQTQAHYHLRLPRTKICRSCHK